MTKRMLAVVDKNNVLTGRIENPSDAEWDAAEPRLRFPHGFDNALKRYVLNETTPGKWRFEPILHRKDQGKENFKAEVAIVPVLARLAAGLPREDDLDKLGDYLKTFDGAL